jgi:Flp pilus assembly protein CpaB
MIDAKRKAFIFLTLAFLLAVAAAGFIINQIQMAQESLGETVRVAAASNDIASYTEIGDDDIKWVEMPKTAQLDSFIKKTDDIDGSIAIVKVKEGDLITKSIVRKKIDIPADHRVVWLNPGENVIIDQGVAEGDLVDIISVIENKEKGILTNQLLKNVKVVQIEKSKDPEEPPKIKVSLSVADAERLIYSQNAALQIRVLRVNQVTEEARKDQTPPQKETKKEEEKPAEKEAAETKKPADSDKK